jgi:Smg protein
MVSVPAAPYGDIMQDNIVEVLIFIYEHFMDSDEPPPADEASISGFLASAGFQQREIDKAFAWMDQLAARLEEDIPAAFERPSARIFSEPEAARLDLEVRGFLLHLEQHGILDPYNRELVIEQALSLEEHSIDIDDLKWIVLLVLMNQPGKENAFSEMEEMIYTGSRFTLH